MSQPMQFFVHQRHQFIARRLISIAPGDQQLGHLLLGQIGIHSVHRFRRIQLFNGVADYTPRRPVVPYYLRPNPKDAPEPTLDFGGYNFWFNKLNSFNGDFTAAENGQGVPVVE